MKLKTTNWWMRQWALLLRTHGPDVMTGFGVATFDASKCRDELGDAARDFLAAKNRYEVALRNLENGT